MDKIYFVVHARMPSEKAYGIHIAQVCAAFVGCGYHVTLVVPSRSSPVSLREFYGVRTDIPMVRLPSFVFTEYKRLGFALMGASFMLSSLVYLWYKRLQGERFVIYTADMDTFAHTLLPLAGRVVAEFHSPKPATLLQQFFFKRAHGIVATNRLIVEELRKTFGRECLVEPNGVDEAFFNIRGGGGGVLYVGRVYKWKGLGVLASTGLPIRVVGATQEEFEKVFGPSGHLQFSVVKPSEVPRVIADADVLLLVGTATNESSNRYTAPMKVFEYLATGKSVVASETEALKSLVPAGLVYWAPPDNAEALAEAIRRALAEPGDAPARVAFAREHTWAKRVERIAKAYL